MSNPTLKKYRVTPPGKVVEAKDTADARRVASGGSQNQPKFVSVEEVTESDLRETVQKVEQPKPEESVIEKSPTKPKK